MAFILSPSAFVIPPAATAASTRSSRAFWSAALNLLGSIPSCFAASATTAWLSSFGEPICVAPIATPPPATAIAAAAPAATLRFVFLSMRVSDHVHLRGR